MEAEKTESTSSDKSLIIILQKQSTLFTLNGPYNGLSLKSVQQNPLSKNIYKLN